MKRTKACVLVIVGDFLRIRNHGIHRHFSPTFARIFVFFSNHLKHI